MSNSKYNGLRAIRIFTVLLSFYYALSSALFAADAVFALVHKKAFLMQFYLFSGAVLFADDYNLFTIFFALVSVAVCIAVICFYRNDISKKTFRMLALQPLVTLVWCALFYGLFYLASDSELSVMTQNIVLVLFSLISLAVPVWYAVSSLKAMKKEL